MKTLQIFTGILNEGFQGNLTYRFHLKESYQYLKIELTYDKDKERIDHLNDRQLDQVRAAYELYAHKPLDADNLKTIVPRMKTEIQLAAFLDETFIGNVHQPGTEKTMVFMGSKTSPGCLPKDSFQGMLKIVVNAFNVLSDDTNYTLKISASTDKDE